MPRATAGRLSPPPRTGWLRIFESWRTRSSRASLRFSIRPTDAAPTWAPFHRTLVAGRQLQLIVVRPSHAPEPALSARLDDVARDARNRLPDSEPAGLFVQNPQIGVAPHDVGPREDRE